MTNEDLLARRMLSPPMRTVADELVGDRPVSAVGDALGPPERLWEESRDVSSRRAERATNQDRREAGRREVHVPGVRRRRRGGRSARSEVRRGGARRRPLGAPPTWVVTFGFMGKTKFIGARIPVDLHEALREQASREHRPLTYVIGRALARDLRRRGRDVGTDAKGALPR